jgi:anti-anti-sigma regulatory factor
VEHSAEQTITIGRGGSGYDRLTLQGHLDHHGTQRLRTQLDEVLDTGIRHVTVDLSDVDLCDENMLDLLCWVERRVAAQQGWLALTGGHHLIRFATIADQLSSRTRP